MDARRKEIRKILIGYVLPENDGLAAGNRLFTPTFSGFYSGSLSARLFGLTVKKRQFRFRLPKKDRVPAIQKAFFDMGRAVKLKTAPDALAVLCYPLLHNPCVMTAEFEKDDVLLCFYAARTLRSPLNALLRFSAFQKRMPENAISKEKVSMECQVIDEKSQKEDKL